MPDTDLDIKSLVSQLAAEPIPFDKVVSMPYYHLKWMLIWNGDFARTLALLEVERDGMARARKRSQKLDKRRRAFLKSIDDHLLHAAHSLM